jgi:NADH-quinone oxidoreductase subunit H
VFFAKTLLIIFVFMWVRWSLPRFRFDQLMNIAWRGLIPIALAQLMATAVLVYLAGGQTADGLTSVHALWFLGMNVILMIGMLIVGAVLPAPPDTNRRTRVAGSRFERTPMAPSSPTTTAAAAAGAAAPLA